MKRSKKISEENTGRKEGEVLAVSIAYSQGGMSFLSGESSRRGYYLHVSIETVEKHDGYTIRTSEVFNSGLKFFLEESARFNAKKLEQLIPDETMLEKMKAQVLDMTKAKVA